MRGTCCLLLLVSCAAALPACGSSIGSPALAPPTDLGVFASTRPTVLAMTFRNPLAVTARVEADDSSGAFSIVAGSLPELVAADAEHEAGVRFTPVGSAAVTGAITLRYEGEGQVRRETHRFRAQGERVVWELQVSPLDFGTIALDASGEREVAFRNASSLSPVTLSGNLQAPSAAWSVDPGPFPLTLAPGDNGRFTLRCAPTRAGSHGGLVRLSSSDGSTALEVPVLAATPGEGNETIVDFGFQAFTGGLTPVLAVEVPADAISLSVEGFDPTGNATLGLGALIGPEDKVYENTALTGAYVWYEGAEIFHTTVPNTDRADLQLVEGGGTYRFRLRRMAGSAAQIRVRAIIERRSPESEGTGTLDLNVWLADGLPVRAATAAAEARLQAILARIDVILAGQGVRLGDVDYYDVTDPEFDEVRSDAEFAALLRTTGSAAAVRLNLFFVTWPSAGAWSAPPPPFLGRNETAPVSRA